MSLEKKYMKKGIYLSLVSAFCSVSALSAADIKSSVHAGVGYRQEGHKLTVSPDKASQDSIFNFKKQKFAVLNIGTQMSFDDTLFVNLNFGYGFGLKKSNVEWTTNQVAPLPAPLGKYKSTFSQANKRKPKLMEGQAKVGYIVAAEPGVYEIAPYLGIQRGHRQFGDFQFAEKNRMKLTSTSPFIGLGAKFNAAEGLKVGVSADYSYDRDHSTFYKSVINTEKSMRFRSHSCRILLDADYALSEGMNVNLELGTKFGSGKKNGKVTATDVGNLPFQKEYKTEFKMKKNIYHVMASVSYQF
jgi:opacity protein-like surface antigen